MKILKPLTIPFKWAVPRSSIKAIKEFKSQEDAPVCPNCVRSRFDAVPIIDEDAPEKAVWSCSNCDFKVTTKGASVDDLSDWLHHNASNVYQNRNYQPKEDEQSDTMLMQHNVDKHMRTCYAFGVFALFMIVIAALALFKGNFFASIICLAFAFAMAFYGIGYNYRAWQAYTNNVFSEDGKQQFHWWLKNHSWFVRPDKE